MSISEITMHLPIFMRRKIQNVFYEWFLFFNELLNAQRNYQGTPFFNNDT